MEFFFIASYHRILPLVLTCICYPDVFIYAVTVVSYLSGYFHTFGLLVGFGFGAGSETSSVRVNINILTFISIYCTKEKNYYFIGINNTL